MTLPSITPRKEAAIRQDLQQWFAGNRRPLPWRSSRDPYCIWVSEIMLQQTQVATVIPFYQRFMVRFPTIASLAAASEQEVLIYWQGLGYYRRARLLHRAAREIAEKHQGVFPRSVEEAAKLPGIGRYTLGAILSQAFGTKLPVVDANVIRVLTRLFACTEEVSQKTTLNWLWNTAEKLLPETAVGDFNQAWMELGQTVCTSTNPICMYCPLVKHCEGRKAGLIKQLPVKKKAIPISQERQLAVVLVRKGKVLLGQRLEDAKRWAGMWEFPTIECQEEDAATCLKKQLKRWRLTTADARQLLSFDYGITRYRVSLSVYRIECDKPLEVDFTYQSTKWLPINKIAEYPLSTPQRKIVAYISKQTKE